MSAWSLRARWVIPIGGPPVAGGVVRVDGDRIVAIEPAGPADLDLGEAAILPGLVNAHTHLDLTGMRGRSPPCLPLPAWLREVIRLRRSSSSMETLASIREGVDECVRTGTTLLGDIAGDGLSRSLLAVSAVRSTVYYELIGMSRERTAQAWNAFRRWGQERGIQSWEDLVASCCREGSSPHAPYSASFELYTDAGSWGWPIATHLAESEEELELLAHHRGPFVEFLQQLGAWQPENMVGSPTRVLELLTCRTPVVIAHGNYLPPDMPIPTNATIVYCPRTHAAFGHPPHPFLDFLQRGVRVALGTDSLASNPDLDMLSEVRFLFRRRPDATPETILRMATLAGAEALGWADETGSLQPGKSADLVVIPITGDGEPHGLVLESPHPVRAVLFRGRWVHDSLGELGPVFA